MSLPEFNRMLHVIKAELKQNRLSNDVAARLFVDIVAVVTRLRSAFMIDYCSPRLDYLEQTITCIASELALDTSSIRITVIEDCIVVVNVAVIPDPSTIAFISFRATDSGSVQPYWAAKGDIQQVASQIQTVKQLLLDPSSRKVLYWDDHVDEVPCMPTLMGYLLGYPAVYLVTSLEQAAAASRCLSSTTLRFYSINTRLQGLLDEDKCQYIECLLRFSIPRDLADEDAHWRSIWDDWKNKTMLLHASNSSNTLRWTPIVFQTHTGMQPVAL